MKDELSGSRPRPVTAAVVVAAPRSGRAGLPARRERRDERGATTAEYAVCTGAGVGFAGVLFKFLTSDVGQSLLKGIFQAIRGLLPF